MIFDALQTPFFEGKKRSKNGKLVLEMTKISNKQVMILESDLRSWLRNVWRRGRADLGLQWIEPAKGSSIGFPDVLIPIAPFLVPVELKIATQNADKTYSSIVRPAQRRFHLLMKKQNMFSCYLSAFGTKENFDVWLSHNSCDVWDRKENAGETRIAESQKISATIDKEKLIFEIVRLMRNHGQFISN